MENNNEPVPGVNGLLTMENKKITPPEGYKFEVISETEIKLVPVETKPKYPTKIEEIEREWFVANDNSYIPLKSFMDSKECNYSTKETALKFAAMMQLVELKDECNKIDGFVADWDDRDQIKWIIYKHHDNKASISNTSTLSRPLAFGSRETAELFLNTHRALIEQAGDLV